MDETASERGSKDFVEANNRFLVQRFYTERERRPKCRRTPQVMCTYTTVSWSSVVLTPVENL